MKVLVTGARGQVGHALASTVPAGVELHAAAHAQLDIADPDAVDACIESLRPEVIVNAAAYTAVDRAESDAEGAHRANASGPANLAQAAARSGARLLHLSTDFVFDGRSSAPYQPDDPTNPLSVYGASKLAGERAVREILPANSVILRTAWVYDSQGRNFVHTMLRLMRERGAVKVVADQIGSPTSASSIAEALWAIIARPGIRGVNHWTDSGVASWYDFAVAIAEEWAQATHAENVAIVVPIGTADYPTPAKRPRFSVLDKTSTSAALGLVPRHWRHNLRQVIGEISIA